MVLRVTPNVLLLVYNTPLSVTAVVLLLMIVLLRFGSFFLSTTLTFVLQQNYSLEVLSCCERLFAYLSCLLDWGRGGVLRVSRWTLVMMQRYSLLCICCIVPAVLHSP